MNPATQRIVIKARLIKKHGNRAVHKNKVITQYDARTHAANVSRSRTGWPIAKHAEHDLLRNWPSPELAFNDALPPKSSPVPVQTHKKLEELANSLAAKDADLARALKENETARANLDEELQQLRAVVAAARGRQRAAAGYA